MSIIFAGEEGEGQQKRRQLQTGSDGLPVNRLRKTGKEWALLPVFPSPELKCPYTAASSRAMACMAATGSGAAVMGRPITR